MSSYYFCQWFEESIDVSPEQLKEKALLKEFLVSINCITVETLQGLDFALLPEETPIALQNALKSAITTVGWAIMIKGELGELSKEIRNVILCQHVIEEKLAKLIDFVIVPSELKKCGNKFLDLLENFGFGRINIASIIQEFSGACPQKSAELDYTFYWDDGQLESASYEPLLKHLHDHGICAVDTSEGQGLPDKLLYYEEIWTLKKNLTRSSRELKKTGEYPIFKYILQGTTDLVRVQNSADSLGKSNNRYFIEIKRAKDFVEEDALREAVAQLIGGNVSNYFHSPPVLLTNLNDRHYVLYITIDGNNPVVNLRFKLNVVRMPTFGVAVAFAEMHTAEFRTVTLHMGRRPTPSVSPWTSDDDDDDDNHVRF